LGRLNALFRSFHPLFLKLFCLLSHLLLRFSLLILPHSSRFGEYSGIFRRRRKPEMIDLGVANDIVDFEA
jgi:hypothetical protein